MEKYCPKCHKTYGDLKAKFCTNCATELIIREKRKPIPRELRHKILVRDGYRCRECGKGKDETSLEIDHIYILYPKAELQLKTTYGPFVEIVIKIKEMMYGRMIKLKQQGMNYLI